MKRHFRLLEDEDEQSTIVGWLGYYFVLMPLYWAYRIYIRVMTGKWEEP